MQIPTTVWLIRHGAVDGVEGRCCGQLDVGLGKMGLGQAKDIAMRLSKEPISHIYSSALRRAVATAQCLAQSRNLTVQSIAALNEMNFGDLEGLRYEEIQERWPDVFKSWMATPAETQFPNGE